MQDRLRRATLRARHSPRPVRRSSTPWQKLLRSSTSSDRPLMPHEHSNFPPETIPLSELTTSRSRGILRIRSWWTSCGATRPPRVAGDGSEN